MFTAHLKILGVVIGCFLLENTLYYYKHVFITYSDNFTKNFEPVPKEPPSHTCYTFVQ